MTTSFRLTDRNRAARDVAIFDSSDPSDEAVRVVVKIESGDLVALNRHCEPLGYLVKEYRWEEVREHPAVRAEKSNTVVEEADHLKGDAVWFDAAASQS
jgi:hypothetical protein